MHSLLEDKLDQPAADSATAGRLSYAATQDIHSIVSSIGRTEDIKLSPDNKRLAVVGFLDQKIYLFNIRFDVTTTQPSVEIIDYSIISSPSFKYPHGITFLDNSHIVVCSRSAGVDVFKLPPESGDSHEHNLKPACSIPARGHLFAKVKTPGSVDSYRISEDRYRILVCNNHWHFVTSHVIDVGKSYRIRNEGILLENVIKIPDGIAVSSGGAWIAISNHVSGEVLLYRNAPSLGRNSEPSAYLVGPICPHGVRFAPDGKRIFVADAASRYLHVFESENGRWEGRHEPATSVQIIDKDLFRAGRYAAREGGLKGVDIDASNSVLITTHMHDVVAFYQLSSLLSTRDRVDEVEAIALAKQRDEGLDRSQREIFDRRWTLGTRLKHDLVSFGYLFTRIRRRLGVTARIFRYYLQNLLGRRTVVDPAGPVVSLTTHGRRLERSYLAIESIAAGRCKPSRIILWLENEELVLHPPRSLKRLQARGLEIAFAKGYGPHTKYYPYIEAATEFRQPLVTADDDILYPKDWLERLTAAFASDPTVIHCHRVHRIGFYDTELAPYNEWEPCLDMRASHLNFITGAGGAIYPPDFLEFLKKQGSRFSACCPLADDIWLTVNATRRGVKVAQVAENYVSRQFVTIPGSQQQALYKLNVEAGGNQEQLVQTVSQADLAKLQAHWYSEVAAEHCTDRS